MKYEWKTTDIWSFNHLVSDNAVYCFGTDNLIQGYILIRNYTETKQKCMECEAYKEKISVYANGPNVLHINRKIFI